MQGATRHFERAVAQDSALVLASGELALTHSAIYYNATPDSVHQSGSRRAAERAVALDPQSPLARRAMGDYYSLVRRDWDRGLEQYAWACKCRRRTPNCMRQRRSRGRAWDGGRKRWLRSAGTTLDPRSVMVVRQLTVALLWLRRYPEALVAANRTLTLALKAPGAVITKVMILLAQGDLAGARAFVRAVAAQRMLPGCSPPYPHIGTSTGSWMTSSSGCFSDSSRAYSAMNAWPGDSPSPRPMRSGAIRCWRVRMPTQPG